MNDDITLATIEEQAELTAEARAELLGIIERLKAGIDQLKAVATPELRAALAAYNTANDALREQIHRAPQLFDQPRTRTFHGLKVGFQKSKDSLVIDDDDRCCMLIEKHLPDQADVLVITIKKPAREAMKQLSKSELKRVGARMVDGVDQLVLKPIDGDIEKLMKALVGDPFLTEEDGNERAA